MVKIICFLLILSQIVGCAVQTTSDPEPINTGIAPIAPHQPALERNALIENLSWIRVIPGGAVVSTKWDL